MRQEPGQSKSEEFSCLTFGEMLFHGAVVQRVLAKLVSPLWVGGWIRHRDRHVITGARRYGHLLSKCCDQICLDYGMIDES
ncbi:unnamed protein product [Arctogadus glacialis]